MVTRNIFGISNKALTPLPSLFGKKIKMIYTWKLILYDMGNFSLCQQTNVQEGFKKDTTNFWLNLVRPLPL